MPGQESLALGIQIQTQAEEVTLFHGTQLASLVLAEALTADALIEITIDLSVLQSGDYRL